ncbi:MAG: hypothetical protein IT459_21935 [Planctomycetes bacterium]|nr:hypothetical protein [Planctomycetota bacterium]
MVNVRPINVGSLNVGRAPVVLPDGAPGEDAAGVLAVLLAVAPIGIAPEGAAGSVLARLQVQPVGIAGEDAAGTPSVVLNLRPGGAAGEDGAGVLQIKLGIGPVGAAPEGVAGPVSPKLELRPVGGADESSAGPVQTGLIGTPAGLYEAMSNAIREHFETTIETALSIPTQYDNEYFEPPASSIWVRFAVAHGQSDQVETGHALQFEKTGEAVASIMQPLELGDGAMLELYDQIADAFRGLELGAIRFGAPYASQQGRVSGAHIVGSSAGGAWWRLDVRCPFTAIDTITTPSVVTGASVGVAGAAGIIRTRLDALVATPAGISVQHDNQAFQPTDGQAWLRFSVRGVGGDALDIASVSAYRSAGVATAQVFTPVERGDGDALALADQVVAAFRGVTDHGVAFLAPTVKPIGASDSWWQVNVSIPWRIEQYG